MPELPEVETVARTLAPEVCGRAIVRAELIGKSAWEGGIGPEALERVRPVICGTGRRGKLLLLFFQRAGEGVCSSRPTPKEPAVPDMSARWPLMYTAEGTVQAAEYFPKGAVWPGELAALAFHLRMTGRVFVFDAGVPAGPHTRAVFTLDNGKRLFFDDVRKFGRIRCVSLPELPAWNFWNTLGPEPLELTGEAFASRFASVRPVKTLLLDQSVVAGVGNIYACESLFRAGIRPGTPGRALSPSRLKTLHACLKEILLEAIRECGSSIRDYRTARGDAGAFQNHFRVYGRAGEPCLACGTTLHSVRIAGRTTVFCPRCQRG